MTPNLALRLTKLTGRSPQVWLNMQQAYDIAATEAETAADLAKIPTLEAAYFKRRISCTTRLKKYIRAF